MKKMSIAQLFGARSGEGEKPAEGAPSAAERLGRALLDTLGAADDGVTEDELVETILGEWGAAAARGDDGDEASDEDESSDEDDSSSHGELYDGTAEEQYEEGDEDSGEEEEREAPFERMAKRPTPMRTGSAASDPVDYSDMSSAQFRELRKLLKKAAAEGKRIRL